MRSLHATYWNKTGVCHLHLTHFSQISLPLQTSLNHAPLATYPHCPTQAGEPSGLQPPSISGEEVSHSHLYTRSVDHLEFKRLQSQIPTSDPRIAILHAVEPLQRGVVRTESEFPSQEIISEGEDSPPDGQTLLLYGAVLGLSLRELATNVQHRQFVSLYLLGQDCTPLSDASVCNKKGREKSGERLPG